MPFIKPANNDYKNSEIAFIHPLKKELNGRISAEFWIANWKKIYKGNTNLAATLANDLLRETIELIPKSHVLQLIDSQFAINEFTIERKLKSINLT